MLGMKFIDLSIYAIFNTTKPIMKPWIYSCIFQQIYKGMGMLDHIIYVSISIVIEHLTYLQKKWISSFFDRNCWSKNSAVWLAKNNDLWMFISIKNLIKESWNLISREHFGLQIVKQKLPGHEISNRKLDSHFNFHFTSLPTKKQC